MTEHEIKVWLRSPEWNQGLFLLSKYSQHPSIRQAIIMMGESRVSKAKMVSTLQAILDLATPTEAPAPEKTIAPPTPKEDNLLRSLTENCNANYQRMAVIHARIATTKTQEDRLEISKQFDAAQLVWAESQFQKDHYLKHNKLPEPKKKETTTKLLPASDLAELLNLRSKVSRAQNQQIPSYIKKLLSNPKDKKTTKKLEKRQTELAQWQARINQLTPSNE